MWKFTPVISFFIFCFFVFPVNTFAATYYVSSSGSDSNSGTEQSPWKTIQKGVNGISGGDTLYVRSGTYQEKVSVNKSGSTDAPTVISSFPNELAIIDGKNNLAGGEYSGLVSVGGSNVVFRNFEVKNSNGRGIQLNGTNNKAIGNKVHHTFDIGIYISGSHITVENNEVWRASERNYVHYSNKEWTAGIGWGASHSPNIAPYAVIRNNVVYQTSGEGILCMYTDNGLVEGNTVYDNWAMNILLDQCSFTTIQNNTAYYTEDKQYWRNTNAPKSGIALDNEDIQSYPMGHDRIVINNVLVNNGVNFEFWEGFKPDSALSNDVIANNTLVNAYSTGIKIDAGPHQNSKVFNNLVLQTRGSAARVSGSGISYSNNLWFPNNGNSGTADVQLDPKLSNPDAAIVAGGVNPLWYSLKDNTSPAIGKAVALALVSRDFSGNNRGNSPDIGAFEFGSSGTAPTTTGLSPTVQISQPTGQKPGDANGDRSVDGVDYVIWLNNYNKNTTGVSTGDFDGNGFVDGIDYVIWLNNYGK